MCDGMFGRALQGNGPRDGCVVECLLALESYNRVTHQVVHSNQTTFANHFGMLAHKQPTNMGKEKSSSRIVWIRISFRVLVMHSVIA